MFDLWLQCYSQREIAEKLGITQPTVKEVIDKVIENGNIAKNKHPHDFTLKRPIRGIKKQKIWNKTQVCSMLVPLKIFLSFYKIRVYNVKDNIKGQR